MKLRQRFCDFTVLKKDITRFAPVWAIYLIGGLLVTIPTLAEAVQDAPAYGAVNVLDNFTGSFSIINLIYAMVVAQLLFGDLFNSRLCNALHAMPLRRETWFSTHVAAGILCSLVPNLVGSLAFIPYLEQYWYAAFLWLGGMMLHYILFFGLSVLAMEVTGNRFAAVVVYGIINFGALLVLYVLQEIYVPLLYGVELNLEGLYRFSPVVSLMGSDGYFAMTHMLQCPCWLMDGYPKDYPFHQYTFAFGDNWSYLFWAAGAGVALLAAALLLYRRRNLETAGNFVAFKPMKPIFRIVFTVAVASFCHMLAAEVFGLDPFVTLIFALVSLAVGYFVSHMLVERTVKVFKKRTFLGLALIAIAVFASLLLTSWDVLGISRRVPSEAAVEKVFIADRTHYSLMEDLENAWLSNGEYLADSPEEIALATRLHAQILQEGEVSNGGTWIGLYYQMKDGTTRFRRYRVSTTGAAYQQARELFRDPLSLFGAETLEELLERMDTVYTGDKNVLGLKAQSLAQALWADMEAGNLSSLDSGLASDKTLYEVSLQLAATDTRPRIYRHLYISYACTHTIAWFRENSEG